MCRMPEMKALAENRCQFAQMPGLVEAAHPRVIRLAGCFSSRMHTPPMARHFIVLTDDRLTAFVELHASIHRQLELR